MAIQTTIKLLEQGLRNVSFQLTGISDGTTQESNVLKIDVSQLDPPCKRVSIMKIDNDVSDGSVTLSWEATTPITFAHLSYFNHIEYDREGGLHNDQTIGDNNTGNIVLSTNGFDVGSTYTVKLWMKKKYS